MRPENYALKVRGQIPEAIADLISKAHAEAVRCQAQGAHGNAQAVMDKQRSAGLAGATAASLRIASRPRRRGIRRTPNETTRPPGV